MKNEENGHIDEYKVLKLSFKEDIGETIFYPLISYPDMKTNYPIGILDLRHQPDHRAPKKIQLNQEYGTDPENSGLFLLLIIRGEKELISDGNNLS